MKFLEWIDRDEYGAVRIGGLEHYLKDDPALIEWEGHDEVPALWGGILTQRWVGANGKKLSTWLVLPEVMEELERIASPAGVT